MQTKAETRKPVHHLAYIKTHKTGSSTIWSIIISYAVSNNLTIALPASRKGNKLGWPELFTKEAATPPKPDVLCHHSRYCVVDTLWKPTTMVWVSCALFVWLNCTCFLTWSTFLPNSLYRLAAHFFTSHVLSHVCYETRFLSKFTNYGSPCLCAVCSKIFCWTLHRVIEIIVIAFVSIDVMWPWWT